MTPECYIHESYIDTDLVSRYSQGVVFKPANPVNSNSDTIIRGTISKQLSCQVQVARINHDAYLIIQEEKVHNEKQLLSDVQTALSIIGNAGDLIQPWSPLFGSDSETMSKSAIICLQELPCFFDTGRIVHQFLSPFGLPEYEEPNSEKDDMCWFRKRPCIFWYQNKLSLPIDIKLKIAGSCTHDMTTQSAVDSLSLQAKRTSMYVINKYNHQV